MKAFRVHASEATAEGRIPYLNLTLAPEGRIEIDFRPLETEVGRRQPSIVLSSEAMYEVLEGKALTLQCANDLVTLIAFGDELIITCQRPGHRTPSEYRVWIAEIALGWNMLTGATGYTA